MHNSRPTAVVTGASAGIGLAIARVLARRQYDLVLVARREPELRHVARLLEEAHGNRARVLPLDLADPGSAAALHRAVRDLGITVDLLVNNAGFGLRGRFDTSDMEVDARMIQVNVAALVALTRAFLPGMIERRSGCVLNVASIASFVPGPYMSVYYATKAFVLSFSEAIAEELRDSGVHVSALCPGPTPTEFQAVAGIRASRVTRLGVLSPEAVAEAGVAGALAGRRVVIPGARNALVPWAARLLPRRVMTRLVRRAAEVG
jgi:short-subunit dehydrogenase